MSLSVYFIAQAFTQDLSRVDRGLHHYPPLIEEDAIHKALSNEFNRITRSIDPQGRGVAFCVTEEFDTKGCTLEELEDSIKDVLERIVSITTETLADNAQAMLFYIMGSCVSGFEDIYGGDISFSHKLDGFQPII